MSQDQNPYGQRGNQPEQPQYGQPQSGPPQYGQQQPPQYGQQPPAAPQYGAEPYGQPTAPPERPRSIDLAVKLMYVGAVLSALGAILGFASMDEMRAMAEETAQQAGTPEMVDTIMAISTGTIIVTSLIAVLLWIWMAIKNGQGRSWARIVATILGGISILSFLFTMGQGATTTLQLVLGVVQLALAIAILVLLWQRTSSQYYAARSQKNF
ncbi:hypothetical protein GCM10023169_37070 [Georgenia halophila]|uniref:Uncharacterized protein n=1 Tax=Georgenia halophila TaxID=620889 RepID=A0ABP8LN34_9MICO